WLGPEGGQYALYFAAGKPFAFDNWQTPHAFQEGEWQVTNASDSSLTFTRSLSLSNYAQTEFKVEVLRKISLLGLADAKAALSLDVPSDLIWVGFASDNLLTNRGSRAWAKKT